MQSTFSRFMITTLLVVLAGCESGGYGRLRERYDEKSGTMVLEQVLPCYVERTYTPLGMVIKKDGPQRNLIRMVDGGVRPMKDADACFTVINGKIKHLPGSCPQLKAVFPEMCVDK